MLEAARPKAGPISPTHANLGYALMDPGASEDARAHSSRR
jgi:hypothetical protein